MTKRRKISSKKKEKREKKIESNKIFSVKRIQNKAIGKSGDILDTVIRFAGFTLLGVIVKNLDKIVITVKTIIEKIKEFAINAKKFFDERVAPFLKDVFNLGKDIFNVFVGISDFLIDLNPYKDFDSEFNILLRGILGFAAKLGELNAPKGKLPGSTTLGSEEPAKTPAKTPSKTPIKSLTRQPAKAAINIVKKTFSPTRTPVGAGTGTGTGAGTGAGVNEDVIKTDRGEIPKFNRLRTNLEKTIAREYTYPQIAKIADDPKMPADVRAAANNILRQRLELQLARTSQPFQSEFDFAKKRSPNFLQKGKTALGDFVKSIQSKTGELGDNLKKIGSTKIPGIGLLNIIPMWARNFVGRSLRLLGLFLLAREVEQDLRNGDVNAAVVKLSAYGLGWLVTSAGLLAGSALGISGVGTVAGVAVLAGSIGAGAGTEALIRKSFLKEEKEKEKESDSTPAKVKPKVPAVVAPKQIPETLINKPDPTIIPKDRGADDEFVYPDGTILRPGMTVGKLNSTSGLDGPTTYGSQGMIKSREMIVAILPVEKVVSAPAQA